MPLRRRSHSTSSSSSATNHSSTGHRPRASSCDHSFASGGNNGSTFPKKLGEMLEFEPDVLTWSEHGLSFFIQDNNILTNKLLPKYFRHTKLTSFQRQLNLYGFRRITKGVDTGAYFHPQFRRDRPDLVPKIRRLPGQGATATAKFLPLYYKDVENCSPSSYSCSSFSSAFTKKNRKSPRAGERSAAPISGSSSVCSEVSMDSDHCVEGEDFPSFQQHQPCIKEEEEEEEEVLRTVRHYMHVKEEEDEEEEPQYTFMDPPSIASETSSARSNSSSSHHSYHRQQPACIQIQIPPSDSCSNHYYQQQQCVVGPDPHQHQQQHQPLPPMMRSLLPAYNNDNKKDDMAYNLSTSSFSSWLAGSTPGYPPQHVPSEESHRINEQSTYLPTTTTTYCKQQQQHQQPFTAIKRCSSISSDLWHWGSSDDLAGLAGCDFDCDIEEIFNTFGHDTDAILHSVGLELASSDLSTYSNAAGSLVGSSTASNTPTAAGLRRNRLSFSSLSITAA